jgi:inner membrane protein
MSSLIGHAATGAAIAFARQGLAAPQARRTLTLLVLLAIVPDFDYFGFWLFGIDLQPRATHSLVFCLGAAAMAWMLANRRADHDRPPIGFFPLALSASSHLLLDLLVGVHSLPIFWPLVASEVSSPVGLLPSAAHVSLTNYYLWRNLFIEMGVLLPILAAIVALYRGAALTSLLRKAVLIVPPWIVCLVWSLGLPR